MHTIVRKGNGEYYVTVVLGVFYDNCCDDTFGRYYIVLNEEKSNIVKQYVYNLDKKPYLDKMVLVVDNDKSDWLFENDSCGYVSFFDKEHLLEYANGREADKDIIKKCIELDGMFVFQEYNEILSQSDVDKLMLVSGGFHDAYIKEHLLLEDGTLKVVFGGVWGCKIEMYFNGDVSYCIESRNPELYDPYWLGSRMFVDNGMITFVDDEDVEQDNINDNYCWFKAKKLFYRVIPN